MLSPAASPLPGLPLMPPGGGLKPSAPWNASKYLSRQFFVYEVDMGLGATFAPNVGGLPIDQTFQTANDSDFFWTELTVFALDGAFTAPTQATLLQAPVVIQVTDEASGRQYDNSVPIGALLAFTAGTGLPSGPALPVPDIAGTAQFPFILPRTVMWEKNSVIKVSVNDESTVAPAGTAVYHLSFLGVKAFY